MTKQMSMLASEHMWPKCDSVHDVSSCTLVGQEEHTCGVEEALAELDSEEG